MNRNQFLLTMVTSLVSFIVGMFVVPVGGNMLFNSVQIPAPGIVIIAIDILALFVIISVHSLTYVRLSGDIASQIENKETSSVIAELTDQLRELTGK